MPSRLILDDGNISFEGLKMSVDLYTFRVMNFKDGFSPKRQY